MKLTVNTKSPCSPQLEGVAEATMLVDVADPELGKVTEVDPRVTEMKVDTKIAGEDGIVMDNDVSLVFGTELDIEIDPDTKVIVENFDIAVDDEFELKVEVELYIGNKVVIEVGAGNKIVVDVALDARIELTLGFWLDNMDELDIEVALDN